MSLVPRWFNRLPSPWREFNRGKVFHDLEEDLPLSSGLSVSSDDKNIYIEAQVPGLTAKEVDVSIDQENLLWIKGEKREEEENKEKKYYRKAHQSFSYCVPLWDEMDQSIEPKATCKDGVMKVTFAKRKEKQTEAKKITVQEE